MYSSKPATVLVSQPPLAEFGLPYLPLMWGILKTQWEHYGLEPEQIDWLAPINEVAIEAAPLLRPYGDTPIDVLVLSCYIWNWKLQCAIAREVKSRYPHCLVIAGGPEVDYKDPKFFQKNPYIDMISVKDAEITLTNIFNKVIQHGSSRELTEAKSVMFADIPGLYLPNPKGDFHICTGPAEVPTEFLYSPYLEQSADYESKIAAAGQGIVALWETNRGCPYKCSYCDWGSNTMSKIRQFPMERIEAEIEWFGKQKVSFLFSTDANFGMLPRDPEIAELVIRSHQKTGFPAVFTYNTSKNTPGRSVGIAKRLIESGLLSFHLLSIQHTSPEVLAATNRSNISVKKQRDIVRELMQDGITTYGQLILGIPGDKVNLWKACLTDMMEWGIHSRYWVNPYNLLPNAPAAEPEFIEKWKIETVKRYVLINHGARPCGPIDSSIEHPALIVQTKTFSRQDWVEMQLYTSFIQCFHCCAVSQFISIYLRFTHNITYAQFYEDLFENFFTRAPLAQALYQAIRDCYQTYLDRDDAVAFMDVGQLPQLEFQLEPSRWLFVQICLQIDGFFDALNGYLMERYPQIANLEDLIHYQKNLMILPSYDRSKGKTFIAHCDWITYFADASKRLSYEDAAMPEPGPTPNAVIVVSDRSWSDNGLHYAFDWEDKTGVRRWIQWIDAMVLGRNARTKNNFQKLRMIKLCDTVIA